MLEEPILDVLGDVRNDGRMHSLMEFIQPNDVQVRHIAEQLRFDENPVRSVQNFVNAYVSYFIEEIDLWRPPCEVLASRQGDCEKTAVLMVSLLRNYFSGEDVFVVVGKIFDRKKLYGHAWVELNGKFLESTLPYDKLIDESKYHPMVKFNDYRAYSHDVNPFGYVYVDDRYSMRLRK
jgi:hypothetical protein